MLDVVVDSGVTFSQSVTVFCSLLSLSCDSEFNSSTSMKVVIRSVWSSLMGLFTFFSDIDLHQKTPCLQNLYYYSIQFSVGLPNTAGHRPRLSCYFLQKSTDF